MITDSSTVTLMDGFGKCVDGYVDVRDQLSRYVLDRASDHLQPNAPKNGLSTRGENSKHVENKSERRFCRASAGYPNEWTTHRSRQSDESTETSIRSSRSCSRVGRTTT